jgi:hypothetical protein
MAPPLFRGASLDLAVTTIALASQAEIYWRRKA